MTLKLKYFFLIICSLLFFAALSCTTSDPDLSKLVDSTQFSSSSPKSQQSVSDTLATSDEFSDMYDKLDGPPSPPINWLMIIGIVLFVALLGVFIWIMPMRIWIGMLMDKRFVWPFVLIRMTLMKIDIELIYEAEETARNAGLKISLKQIESLYLSHVDIWKILQTLIAATHGGLNLTIDELKAHYLANGHIDKVVRAMIATKNADASLPEHEQMKLTFKNIAAIDLSGIDIEEAVKNYLTPQVRETEEILGVAKDGIELTARVRVSVRANLRYLLTGGNIETILAKVNEAVVTSIGQSETHKHILENAFEVGERVMRRKDELFKGYAYDVISVDVSAIRVTRDVNTILETERIDMEIKRHKAKEAEMAAEAAEAKVILIRAEAEVQQAMADAFRDGNMGVNDYHKMMNTEADTNMRRAFAQAPKPDFEQKKTIMTPPPEDNSIEL